MRVSQKVWAYLNALPCWGHVPESGVALWEPDYYFHPVLDELAQGLDAVWVWALHRESGVATLEAP